MRSLERGLEDAIYLVRMFKEIYIGKVSEDHIPVVAKTDSKTLHDSLHSTRQIDEKGIRHLVAWIKEQVEDKMVEKEMWIPNKDMIADVFTKANVKTDLVLSVISGGRL